MKFRLLLVNVTILCFLLPSCSLLKKESPRLDEDIEVSKSISPEDFKINVVKKVLDNGLTILVVENKFLPIFTYYTFYKVGAKFETKGVVGGSHFLEHLMFKGAKKYGMGEFDRIIETNGGTNNAFTSMDLTVYYDSLPTDSLEKIIDLESDRMKGVLLDPEGFEKERQVVLEERKIRYENRPSGMLFLRLMQEAFKGTSYGRSVIGETSEIEEMTIDGIRQYYDDFYSPNNAIIVVAGGVNSAKTIGLISKYYGKIKPSANLQQKKDERGGDKAYSLNASYGKTINVHAQSPTPKFMMAFKGYSQGTRESQVMDILAYIMGSGDSSYLVQKYVKGKGPKLTDVYATVYTMQNGGAFLIGGELLNGVNLPAFQKTLQKDLNNVCKTAINERSVQKIKNQIWVEFYQGLQTNSGVAKYLGTSEAIMGDYNFYKKEIEVYRSITSDEVVDMCEDVFVKGKGIFASVWSHHPKANK